MQDASIIPSEWWLPLIIVAWLSLFLMIMWDRFKAKRQLKTFQNGDWTPVKYIGVENAQKIYDQDENPVKENN